PSQRTTWPPSAAVRQALIAEIARSWPRLTCPLLAAHHAAPWARKMSATSMGSPVSRRLRLKARKLPDKSSYPVTEPFDPGSLSVAISSLGTWRSSSATQQGSSVVEGAADQKTMLDHGSPPVRQCDGFRMPAPSWSSPHARRRPGRRSKAAREGNRGRVGTPIRGRYGDLACSERAARVRARDSGAKSWGETAPRRRLEGVG